MRLRAHRVELHGEHVPRQASVLNCVMTIAEGVITFFFFQAEDGIRDLVRSRGLGDVYKRQELNYLIFARLR